MITTTNLLDADIVAFQAALRCQETTKFGEETFVKLVHDEEYLHRILDTFVESIRNETKADNTVICLSDDDANFRNSVLPTYKESRAGTSRPILLKEAKQYLADNYKSYTKPTLEADDVMGILSTHKSLIKGKKIICTLDKDLYQIPGYIYNWNKPKRGIVKITPDVGYMFHMVQTMTGDMVDGYGGVPGIGDVKAYQRILEGLEDGKTQWEIVLEAYDEWGMTEEDAICIARVAYMCHSDHYDYKNQEVILWEPKDIQQ